MKRSNSITKHEEHEEYKEDEDYKIFRKCIHDIRNMKRLDNKTINNIEQMSHKKDGSYHHL